MGEPVVHDQQQESRRPSASSEHGNVQPPGGDSTLSVASARMREDASDDEEEIHARIRRRQTQITSVPLSYGDLLKGLFFGLKKLRQRLGATMESRSLRVPEEKIYDDRDCEYILTVTVYPRTPTEHLRQHAKCVLDTGCLQGNIISRRLAHSLGFTEYDPLTPREENGATVATGQKHHVLGAVRVSWSHGSSTEVIKNMRFLVSENEHLDLVVGAKSIRKWNLISPPNLGVSDFNKKSDLDGEALAGEEAKLKGVVKKLERRLKELSAASPDRARVEEQIKAAKEKHKIALEELNAYNAGDSGKKEKDAGKPVKSDRKVLKESKGQGKPSPKV